MDIAVIGINPLGCTVACLLGASGEDITIVGAPEQVSRIPDGIITLRQLWDGRTVTSNVRPVDRLGHTPEMIVFATHARDAYAAAEGISQMSADATIAAIQYGTKLDQIIAGYLKRDNIVSCVTTLGVACCSPGEVTINHIGEMVVGRAYEATEDRLDQVVRLMSKVFVTHKRDKIAHFNCTGLLVNLPYAIPAVVGGSAQQVFSDPDMAKAGVLLLQEGMRVIDKSGVRREPLPDLGDGYLRGLLASSPDDSARLFSAMAVNTSLTPYYCPTVECVGRDAARDVEYLNGELVKLAGELDCMAPLNSLMVRLAKKVESDGRFLGKQEFMEEVKRARATECHTE